MPHHDRWTSRPTAARQRREPAELPPAATRPAAGPGAGAPHRVGEDETEEHRIQRDPGPLPRRPQDRGEQTSTRNTPKKIASGRMPGRRRKPVLDDPRRSLLSARSAGTGPREAARSTASWSSRRSGPVISRAWEAAKDPSRRRRRHQPRHRQPSPHPAGEPRPERRPGRGRRSVTDQPAGAVLPAGHRRRTPRAVLVAGRAAVSDVARPER